MSRESVFPLPFFRPLTVLASDASGSGSLRTSPVIRSPWRWRRGACPEDFARMPGSRPDAVLSRSVKQADGGVAPLLHPRSREGGIIRWPPSQPHRPRLHTPGQGPFGSHGPTLPPDRQ